LFISDKLAPHLGVKQECDSKEARMEQTRMRIIYLWCTKEKHDTALPLLCDSFGEWHLQLDNHLKTHGAHRIFDSEETHERILLETKEKYWVKNQAATSSTSGNLPSPELKFVHRSPPEAAAISTMEEAS